MSESRENSLQEEVEMSERLLKEAQTSLQKWNVDIVKRCHGAVQCCSAPLQKLKDEQIIYGRYN